MANNSPDSNSSAKLSGRLSFWQRRWRFLTLALLFAALYVGQFWFFQRVWCTPQELFHRVWATTESNLFNQAALKHWPEYEHKYDGLIHSHDDAIKYANQMLATLDDPFTKFFNQKEVKKRSDAHSGFYSGVGMVMNGKKHPIVVRTIYKGGPAERAGLKTGDQIMQVDQIDCTNIAVNKIGEYTREHLGQSITFKILRRGKSLAINVIPTQFVAEAAKLKGARALVLDLRGNPGGSVNSCLAVASMILEKGVLVTMVTKADGQDFLSMRYSLGDKNIKIDYDVPKKSHKESVSIRRPNVWGSKPVVVLVDEGSASAAEMLAAALQDNHRATVIGVRTYGKGVAQLYYDLPLSTCLCVTAARYYTPANKWLGDGKEDVSNVKEPSGHEQVPSNDGKPAAESRNERGITPDIVVPATDNLDYDGANDNQLPAALQFLKSKLK